MSVELDNRIVDLMRSLNATWKSFSGHTGKMISYLNELKFSCMGTQKLTFYDASPNEYYEVQKFHNKNIIFRDYFLFLVTKFIRVSPENMETKSCAFFMLVYDCEPEVYYEKALLTFEDILLNSPKSVICTDLEIRPVFKDFSNLNKMTKLTEDNGEYFTHNGKQYLGKLVCEDFKKIVFIEDLDTYKRFYVMSDNNFENLISVYKHDKALFFKQCAKKIKDKNI